jgi:hypothetical protein
MYPDQQWINIFKDLSYSNQKRVLDWIIAELDQQTAGTLIVGDMEEDFWRAFAAEHERQNGDKNYDWKNGIEMLISNSKETLKKDLASGEKYIGEDDGSPTHEWYKLYGTLDKEAKKYVLHNLPYNLYEEVNAQVNSI